MEEKWGFDGKVVRTPFPKLKLTVTKVCDFCYHGYKMGDELILEDFTYPPKYFCLGLAHVLFPVIYALSFGAKFPFRDNQRSLLITCPDGGKLEFKAEVLDKDGKAEIIPKDQNYSRPSIKEQGGIPPEAGKGPQPNGSTTFTISTERSRSAKKMIIEVVKSDGKCSFKYKVGDKWETEGLKCIPGFCGAAFHTAFPALFALNFGANFLFMDDPNCIDTVTCPDGGKIVFKVTRVGE